MTPDPTEEVVFEALWRSGLGKLTREEARIEAKRVVVALAIKQEPKRVERQGLSASGLPLRERATGPGHRVPRSEDQP